MKSKLNDAKLIAESYSSSMKKTEEKDEINYRDVVSYLHKYVVKSAANNRITYSQAISDLFDMLADDIDGEHSMHNEREEADKAFAKSFDDWSG